MKNKSLTIALTAVGLTIALAACGSSTNERKGVTGAPTLSHVAPAGTPPTTSAALPSLLPEPTGSFAVGVRTLTTDIPDATSVVWYPARRGSGTGGIPYLSKERAAAVGVTVRQLQTVRIRASANAAPEPGTDPRPAVVLMPGWGLPMALSTALAEDLASHGYVVLTVEPTLGTENQYVLPADTAHPGRRLEQLAAALTYVAGREITPFSGPVDGDRIVAGGHSIAGAVAFQAGLTDTRIAAVFDLDGWLHGPALQTAVTIPAHPSSGSVPSAVSARPRRTPSCDGSSTPSSRSAAPPRRPRTSRPALPERRSNPRNRHRARAT